MISELLLNMGTWEEWKLCLISFFGLIVLFRIGHYLVLNKFKKIAERTKTEFDDFLVSVLSSSNLFIEFAFALFVSTKFLKLNEGAHSFINYIALIALIILIASYIQKIVKYFAYKKFVKHEEDGRKTDASVVNVLSSIGDWVIWIIAILLILQNSGIDIGTLLAGAGIFGIAVAFAAKEVLADLFACFSIYLDRPFEVGDYIVLEKGQSGVILKIGLRTTRVRTLRGEELVVSNRKLTDSLLRNYKKMKRRRITIEICVDPKTSLAKLKKGKKLIIDIVNKTENAELLRANLVSFTGNSWTYEITYYVASRNYGKYLIANENIILSIRKAFDKEKIKFATDIQKIILK